jgi:hypothetical protein
MLRITNHVFIITASTNKSSSILSMASAPERERSLPRRMAGRSQPLHRFNRMTALKRTRERRNEKARRARQALIYL